MMNTVTSNHLSSIKWTVQTPAECGKPIKSTTFKFLNLESYFEFTSDGTNINEAGRKAYLFLRFSCWVGRFNQAIDVILAITSFSKTISVKRYSIIGTRHQEIWTHLSSEVLDTLLTFELIVLVDHPKKDNSVQTVSSLNADASGQNLSKDFSKLLDTGLNHDVEVRCGEQSIKAHKIILCSRSEVLKAMLEGNFQEAATGIIEIKDMDDRYFQDFIRYLYTDALPELSFEKAKVLYEAGDKYAIRHLMHLCSEYIQINLSSENAFECVVLADAHSDQQLIDGVINYVLDKKLYLQSGYWEPFCERFPKVAIKVYKLSHENCSEEQSCKAVNI